VVKRLVLRKPQGLRWTDGVEWLDLNESGLNRSVIDFSRHLVTSLIVCAETSESGDPPEGAAGGGTNSSRVDTERCRPEAEQEEWEEGAHPAPKEETRTPGGGGGGRHGQSE